MRDIVTVGLVVLALAVGAAQGSPSDDARIAWLGENAVRITSLAADAPHDDLAPLAAKLGAARVVLLGEQTHGEATTFAAKIRLVRTLHEEHGFDVLVFESGMYGCREADRAFAAGKLSPVAAAGEGIFPIWTRSAQLAPLWEYIAARRGTDRPLELAGYDCQVTGRASARLLDDLRAVAADVGFRGDDLDRVLTDVGTAVDARSVPASEKEGKRTAKAYDSFRRALAGPPRGARLDAAERAFWTRFLASVEAQAANQRTAGERERKRLAEQFNPRDAQGGANLVWLANERYAGRKLIVWLATMHAQRNAHTIDTQDRALDYKGVETAGHHLWKALGQDVYVVGFVSAEGRGGLPWTAPGAPLPAPPQGSFEDLCVRAGLENAFVDLRGTPAGHWLRERNVAAPLGNSPMRAVWPDVLDALVFLKTRTPSTSADDGAAAESAPFDLLPAVEQELRTMRSGEDGGNVWATKWHLGGVWERWVGAVSPDADAVADEEERLLAWWRKAKVDDSRAWRVHDLLAQMAERRGDLGAARQRYDDALAAHPEQDVPDPGKHSGFQHLVNRAGLLRLRADGLAKAQAFATDLLAEDPRFHVFWFAPWDAQLEPGDRTRLVAAVVKAYEKRLKAFPGERARIERELAALR